MKKIILGLAGIALIFGLMGNVGATNATLYVDNTNVACDDTTGAPYCTIQAAINVTNSGDTIEVADSTYTITSKISVNEENITITGNTTNPENVVVQYSDSDQNYPIFDMRASGVTIEGVMTINGKSGFWFDQSGVTGCTISHCIIDPVNEYGIYMKNGGSEHTIEHNTISNTGQTYPSAPAILIEGSLDITIDNNTLSSISDKGIAIWAYNATSEADRVEVINNTISGCEYPAIQTSGGKYTYISGNIISSTNDKGINIIRSGATGETDKIQVIGNTISETKWPGIQIIGAPYTYVHDNTLTKCNYHGGDGTGDWDYASIHVQDDGTVGGANVVIDSNTVSDGINGIQTWSNNTIITNNEIYDMGLTYADEKIVGDITYKNSGILAGSVYGDDPTGTVVEYNNIYNNYWGLFYSEDLLNGVVAENNWWGHASGPSGEYGRVNKQGKVIGKGDAVSANVDWNPWLPQPVGHTLHHLTPPGLVKHKKFTLPENAVEVSSGIFYLGESKDKGKVVEGYAFMVKDNEARKARKPKDNTCYAFLARGAKWKTVEDYIVDPTNADGLNELVVRDLLSSSIAKWEGAANYNILGDETNGVVDGADTVSPDSKNEVMFGDIESPGVIGFAIMWGIFGGPPSQRVLVEWDMVFDDADFDWGIGEVSKMDFENIATHELGHAVGLGDLYNMECSEQTMYGYSTEGEIKKRTLESGDIAGIQKLY